MIFALFCLQSLSIAFGTVTKIYDIETLINSYLSHTIDENALHATSYDYMQIVEDESHWQKRYFQSLRYIKYGFPMYTNSRSYLNTSSTNDTVYKKLNFIQSIAFYYCGMNMSDIMNASLDNIHINESQLYMNLAMFAVQLVESYELIRSEICERIKLGLHQSVVNMFNPHANDDSFFSGFIQHVADFTFCKATQPFSLESLGRIYPFLAKFGEFESYKETVIHQIWKIDNFALQSKVLGHIMYSDIDVCVSQIEHPQMYKYVTDILKQQVISTGNTSFILNHHNTTDFRYYVEMYQLSTGSAINRDQIENKTIDMRGLLRVLDECRRTTGSVLSTTTMTECTLIVFRIYESYQDGTNGHEYVLNAIKCIISNRDVYCSKFSRMASGTDYDFYSNTFWIDRLRESLNEYVFYPYVNEIMNDTEFINFLNNNTNSETDGYLQTILSNLMMISMEEYGDIEMIKKIATVFASRIHTCRLSQEFMYLTKYFQQRLRRQVDANCTQSLLLS